MNAPMGKVNGLTNGRRPGTGRKLPLRRPSRTLAGFLALVVLGAIMASAYILAYPTDLREPIQIDGGAADWDGGLDDSVRWMSSPRYLFFGLQANTSGANGKMDALRLWLDTDRDANTGLLLWGAGMDVRITLEAWEGSMKTASFCVWQRDSAPWNSRGFAGCRGFPAAAGPGVMEGAIRLWWIGMEQDERPRAIAEHLPASGESRQRMSELDGQPFRPSVGPWLEAMRADGDRADWGRAVDRFGRSVVHSENATGECAAPWTLCRLDRMAGLESISLFLGLNPWWVRTPVPYAHVPPPSGEREPKEHVDPATQLPPEPLDLRQWVLIRLGNTTATLRMWEGEVMEAYRDNGTAYGATVWDTGIEVGIPGLLWTGNVTVALMDDATHRWMTGEDMAEPEDVLLELETFGPMPLGVPDPPWITDILGNDRYWFRDTADSTETACTGTNDKQALTTQGAGAVKTITLTTGQNACWYLPGTLAASMPAGDWETLLDIQTTGDNGGSGEAVGAIGYKSNTGACAGSNVNCPKYKAITTAPGFGSEVELSSIGAAVENVRVLWDPLLSYVHYLIAQQAGAIEVFRCDDVATCSSIGTATTQTVGTAPERHWDAAIEQSSGDGLLVYDDPVSESNDLCYRTFAASATLGGEFCFEMQTTSTNPSFGYITLASNPGSDYIAAGFFDTTNDDITLDDWDGSAWGTTKVCTSAATLTNGWPVAIGVEDSSNEFTAYCGNGANSIQECEWTADAWEGTCRDQDVNPSAGNDVKTIECDFWHGTNTFGCGQEDDQADVDVWIFHGAAGTGGTYTGEQEPSFNTGFGSIIRRGFTVAWDPTDDNVDDFAVFLWDSTDARCEYRTYNDATNIWTGTLLFGTCTVSTSQWWESAQAYETSTDEVQVCRVNAAFDVLCAGWDGTRTVTGETTITTDTVDSDYPHFDLEYGPRPVEYDVRIEIWNVATDTVSSTIGSCLNVVTRGDDVQCLVSGVGAQALGANEEVRIYIAHSSAAGSVIISYDDADTTGDSRATLPIPEFTDIAIPAALGLIVLAVIRRRRKRA